MTRSAPTPEALRSALACYEGMAEAKLHRLAGGLINDTFEVRSAVGRFVLQRLHPVFDPRIHENLAAVTSHLAHHGLETPQLIPTAERAPQPGTERHAFFVDLGMEGVFRLWTLVPGESFARPPTLVHTKAAGRHLARFHSALADLSYTFVGLRTGVHDTPAHLERLSAARETHHTHRLYDEVARLSDRLFQAATELPPLRCDVLRTGHGDPKLANFLFEADATAEPTALRVALVDLDTTGPVSLVHELGDAMRSWCNRAGEDETEAQLDLDAYASAFDGYLAALDLALEPDEAQELLFGLDLIALELSARFLADALEERYFGFDPVRFAAAGEHNLHRALGQWSLHLAAARTRKERDRLLRTLLHRHGSLGRGRA